MLASALINTEITALRPSDTVNTALNWMDEFKVRHLPVVEDGKLLGMIGDMNLLAVEDEHTPLGQLPLHSEDIHAHDHQQLFEFLHFFKNYGLSLIPILNKAGNYQGVIGEADLFHYFAEAFSTELGGVLMLSMDYRDYSLSEISRLVESNKARVIGTLVEVDPENNNRLFLTLKLNTSDTRYVVATLERFGYKLIGQFQWQEEAVSVESDRLNSLMKFLDV